MARTPITSTGASLQSDDGNVLWSLVQGEQLEFEVTLGFLLNASMPGYTYEAVVAEGANSSGSIPTEVQPGGVKTALVVRIPTDRGVWSAAGSYNREDIVAYGGLTYKLLSGINRVAATIPSADSFWAVYVPNKVFIQFPATLGTAWTNKPSAAAAAYGFFELAVTEPAGGIYTRTWKPMRGVVELLFSPTELL
jgi:hypothetical protein